MIYLRKGINTRSGEEIVKLEGDTYPFRYEAKNLGFIWYGKGGFWFKPKGRLSSFDVDKLSKLGVDVSEIGQTSQSSIPPSQPSVPSFSQEGAGPSQEEEPKKNITNKTDFDEFGENYDRNPGVKYMGFPIKKGIYIAEVDVPETEDKIKITVDRGYEKGRRGIPRYKFRLNYGEIFLGAIGKDAPGQWAGGQPLFDEDSFIYDMVHNQIRNLFDKNKPTKAYGMYLSAKKLEARDPHLVEFLKYWEENQYDKEKSQELNDAIYKILPKRFVKLSEPGYEGDFPVSYQLVGKNVYIETAIDDPTAPRASILTTLNIGPRIQNFQDLNSALDTAMEENKEEIAKTYINYLKSFPYSKEEKEKSVNEMAYLVGIVGHNYDVKFFKNKLIEKGFIRPSKRQRQEFNGGMIPQEDISFVIDDKNIRDAVYARNAGNKPDFLYSVLAYYLMRKARNITSISEIMLVTNIGDWVSLAKKYGTNLKFTEVMDYLDKLSSMLYLDLTGRNAPKSSAEQYADFYGGYGSQNSSTSQVSNTSSLEDFVSFAINHGSSEEEARQKPKAVYRQLAFQLHPDKREDKSDVEFKTLTQLYDNLPDNLKMAKNWYERSIYG